MRNHIVPRVLLKGYATGVKSNRIRYLEKNEVKSGNIANVFQIREYYNDETELILGQQFESNYGRIRKMIIESMADKTKEKLVLTAKQYSHLIRFYIIMWRRNDENYNNSKMSIEKLVEQLIDSGVLPKEINVEEAINSKEFQHKIFELMAKITKPNDPIVLKTKSWYKPYIIYNESNLSFPLHSRIGSVNKIDTLDPAFPRMLIEPVKKNIMLLFVLNENVKQDPKSNRAIDKIFISDINMIELLIRLYIVKSSERVVIDDSNVEFIKGLLSEDVEEIELESFSVNFRRLFDMVL